MELKKINYLLLFLLSGITILSSNIGSNILNFDELYSQSLTVNLPMNQVKKILEFQKKIYWLNFIFTPIVVYIKTFIIASIIYIGIIFNENKQLNFNLIWNFILKAEFVFILVNIFKIIWFYFFQTDYKLEDIQYFYPLSALNIVGYKDLEPWFVYPFQTLNLFELAYWLILAYYIGKTTKTNMDHGLKIVAYSYGLALLLWVVTIMFFTLNYS